MASGAEAPALLHSSRLIPAKIGRPDSATLKPYPASASDPSRVRVKRSEVQIVAERRNPTAGRLLATAAGLLALGAWAFTNKEYVLEQQGLSAASWSVRRHGHWTS